MIRITDLSKTYTIGDETVHALDGANLHVAPGEFVGIIGPSGSGKSTLMNIIGCLDTADSGEYLLDGTPIEAYSENELARILIPQTLCKIPDSNLGRRVYGRAVCGEIAVNGRRYKNMSIALLFELLIGRANAVQHALEVDIYAFFPCLHCRVIHRERGQRHNTCICKEGIQLPELLCRSSDEPFIIRKARGVAGTSHKSVFQSEALRFFGNLFQSVLTHIHDHGAAAHFEYLQRCFAAESGAAACYRIDVSADVIMSVVF